MGIVGVCLLGASIFVHPDIDAHRLIYDITRWIMIAAGSLAIFVAVISFLFERFTGSFYVGSLRLYFLPFLDFDILPDFFAAGLESLAFFSSLLSASLASSVASSSKHLFGESIF